MECNKEEAVRAKGIAEKKMQNKDFVGARKFALKAQQLNPGLDNVSQMILACDVHCSAENKVYGNEKDWYGILKIEPTADETLVRKQYGKFAVLLHPDNKKFAGAADAFRLIGEAKRVLLDSEQRMLHDSKCRTSLRPTAPSWAPQQSNGNSNVGEQPWVQNNRMRSSSQFKSKTQHQQPQQKTQCGSNNRQTFGTLCPFCGTRYEYDIEMLNKFLSGRSCKWSFLGFEINTQSSSPWTNRSQHALPQEKDFPSQGASMVGLQSTFENPNSKVGSQRNVGDQKPTRESFPHTSDGGRSKTNEKCGNVDVKISMDRYEDINSSGQMNGKRMKQVAECNESHDTGSRADSEEFILVDEDGDSPCGQNVGCLGEQHPQRTTWSKRNVSCNETLIDDGDFIISSKRAKYSGSFIYTGQEAEDPIPKYAPQTNESAGCGTDMEVAEIEVKHNGSASIEGRLQIGKEEIKMINENATATDDDHKKSSKANGESSSNSNPNEVTNPELFKYPDPDFSDFEKDRREECFRVGQTWAVYDTLDAMPRFYARVRKVLSPGFKLRITWLDPESDEINHVDEGLPVSCGKFNHGKSETTEDHRMFSHLIYWEKGSKRDTYKIYPRKGETWALFKKWDRKWYSDPDSERKYEFEFVEVLSEYTEDVGVSVAYLGKVKGFACLFC
ncbi:uncharacterized protein LOC132275230 [Cornus florida]|uniref:uncharacterized protein LOC132275230 n=1 Tax=Cornus florida TaxID=4283 RepID=UPI00289F0963|nr:uncharacterized protein LOC132275230 [Cornus florida]